MTILNQFRVYIEEQHLFEKKDPILLAVSAGIDSMVMADLFFRSGYSFSVAHGNFKLRYKDSDLDEAHVVNWCNKRGIEVFTRHFKIAEAQVNQNLSIQMAARNLRHAWFKDICIASGFSFYALAHHKEDDLETIIINLLRGTGIAGLRGMLPKNGMAIRPLLCFSQNEILEESIAENITYREDSSNTENKYIRNQIRHLIIPELKKINPKVEQTVADHKKRLQFTEWLAKVKMEEVKFELWENTNSGRRISFSKLEPYRFYGAELLFFLLEPFGFIYSQCIQIWSSLGHQSGTHFSSNKHRLWIDREFLYLESFISPPQKLLPKHRDASILFDENLAKDFQSNPEKKNHFLNLKDYISIKTITEPEKVNKIRTMLELQPASKKLNAKKSSSQPKLNSRNLISGNFTVKAPKHQANKIQYINGDLIYEPLALRFWEEGDLFWPLGMNQSKKLSDFFIDLKIPQFEKSKILILVMGENIIWIVGYRIDQRFRVTMQTKTLLELTHLSNKIDLDKI